MPEITISNLFQKSLKTNEKDKPILKILHENSIDWMHACGGKGRCTTCKMIVEEGIKNISLESDFETKLRKLGALKSNERLACQCTLQGDIRVAVPEKSKLPHMQYSDD
ncbi:(2Fe-2S)-binding protein [Fulvivirga sp. RKSG066]|uniref:2Fe-2S iron-sulfur cluster-binding protein n=1 Tax=Fulvivirga aurantia TaxID=2529383 RepID=UPI0012BB67DB|nr:2Fe-2S iron-sulfur cluster-binding protein [Fulvivirga aurantia]MTI19442.1 (2Fe-2S)-binding protein [Fulvivirga aurantia]